MEDLWAFNEEIVARAIFLSSIPIMSAVGHEVDFTIADFVADYRAPTPSAAAETISPDQDQWLSHFNYLAAELTRLLTHQLSDKNQRLTQLHHRLKRSHPGAQMERQAQRLDDCQARFLQAPRRMLQHRKWQLSELTARLINNNPSQQIQQLQHQLTSYHHRLTRPIQNRLQQARIRFTDCNKGLETLSPLATLARGYSITKRDSDGTIINSIQQLKLNEKVNIQLVDGSVKTSIESLHETS